MVAVELFSPWGHARTSVKDLVRFGGLDVVVIIIVKHKWAGRSGQDHGSRGRPKGGRGSTCLFVVVVGRRLDQDVFSVVGGQECAQGPGQDGPT